LRPRPPFLFPQPYGVTGHLLKEDFLCLNRTLLERPELGSRLREAADSKLAFLVAILKSNKSFCVWDVHLKGEYLKDSEECFQRAQELLNMFPCPSVVILRMH
jgi:hypothetical protein